MRNEFGRAPRRCTHCSIRLGGFLHLLCHALASTTCQRRCHRPSVSLRPAVQPLSPFLSPRPSVTLSSFCLAQPSLCLCLSLSTALPRHCLPAHSDPWPSRRPVHCLTRPCACNDDRCAVPSRLSLASLTTRSHHLRMRAQPYHCLFALNPARWAVAGTSVLPFDSDPRRASFCVDDLTIRCLFWDSHEGRSIWDPLYLGICDLPPVWGSTTRAHVIPFVWGSTTCPCIWGFSTFTVSIWGYCLCVASPVHIA